MKGALTMQQSKELSYDAQELLKEIILHENELSYWKDRFENLSRKEEAILRGFFKDLIDNEMIKVLWGGNIPIHIQILKDGYLYEDAKLESSKVKIQDTSSAMLKYDVFISHANRDKNELVDELNRSLKELGVTIFYDTESLDWGDNWKEKILEGTAKSEFAIIVISKNFLVENGQKRNLMNF